MEKEQKKRCDVMVDIETLSTNKAQGLIVEVAMVPFDITNGSELEVENGMTFSVKVLESLLSGRVVDESTLQWWKGQSAEAKERLLRNENVAKGVKEGCEELYSKLKELDEKYDLWVWSKGIGFDFPMIESQWEDLGIMHTPYKFWKKLDMRTVLNMASMMGWQKKQKREDIRHGAYEDCVDQIAVLWDALGYVKAGR